MKSRIFSGIYCTFATTIDLNYTFNCHHFIMHFIDSSYVNALNDTTYFNGTDCVLYLC